MHWEVEKGRELRENVHGIQSWRSDDIAPGAVEKEGEAGSSVVSHQGWTTAQMCSGGPLIT